MVKCFIGGANKLSNPVTLDVNTRSSQPQMEITCQKIGGITQDKKLDQKKLTTSTTLSIDKKFCSDKAGLSAAVWIKFCL